MRSNGFGISVLECTSGVKGEGFNDSIPGHAALYQFNSDVQRVWGQGISGAWGILGLQIVDTCRSIHVYHGLTSLTAPIRRVAPSRFSKAPPRVPKVFELCVQAGRINMFLATPVSLLHGLFPKLGSRFGTRHISCRN